MKIALVGTSCVGKTSIIESLREKYTNDSRVEFVEEGARAFFAANPHIEDRGSWEAQSGIRNWVLSNEQTAHAKDPYVIICDRSVIDSAVYMQAHGNQAGSQKLLKLINDWIETYDLIILLDPTEVPYQTDDIRIEGPEFRSYVHEIFIKFFKNNNINYQIVSGSLEDRIEQIEKLFSVVLKNDSVDQATPILAARA